MFYSGGARKKHALREILKFNPEKKEESEIDSSSEDHDPPRDSDHDDDSDTDNTDNSSDESDTHAAEDAEADDDDDDDDSSTYPVDNNDYLVTLGSTDTTGKHYRYAFIDEELDYDLEEFADMHPDIKTYQLMIYKINTHSSSPFLEFLLYHEKDDDQASCILPFYNHTLKRNIRKETDGIMRKLFTGKYRYKGFFHEISTDKCFIFYEKYYVHEVKHEKNSMVSLHSSSAAAHHWLWVCTNEILYQQRYMMISIHDDAVNFFTNYPTVGILQATSISTSTSTSSSTLAKRQFHDVNIEAPTVLYYGTDICYARNTAIYGAKREPIISRYGPFYYFTTLEHSFYWACYMKSDKKVKRRETSNGGISRYAVFTKKMKTAFADDDYDVDVVKKYIDRKNIFETKINQTRQTQEVYKANRLYDSIYAHGYDWTIDYDTIYNGYYHADKKDVLRPVWCIHNHHNFQLLSYYEVNMDKTPEQYDPLFTDYAIM
jgi:hypothetical protein